jgi:hypothetical protein
VKPNLPRRDGAGATDECICLESTGWSNHAAFCDKHGAIPPLTECLRFDQRRTTTAVGFAIVMGKAGLLLCMSVLTACASDAGYSAPQGFQACDRNGGQEERRACLP